LEGTLAPVRAAIWIAYGIVRLAMGFVGYGGEEWFPRRQATRDIAH
jgi:hypothetical protein